MPPDRQPDSPPEPDDRAIQEARVMFERAEAAWQRQLKAEESVAPVAGYRVWRAVLLGAAILAILVLLFQRLALGG